MKTKLYERNDHARTGLYVEVERPRSLLSKIPAVRFAQLNDMFAPMGDDGERHPEAGVITAEQFRTLLEMP